MKKFFLFTTAVAAALTLASCDKTKKQVIEYETPVYTEIAVKYEIPQNLINDAINVKKYSSFEVTETGDYLIVEKRGAKTGKITNLEALKDKGKNDDKIFECADFGLVEVKYEKGTKAAGDITVIFTPKDEIPIVLTATPAETSENINKKFLQKIIRKWKITDTTISVSGGDLPEALGIAKNFKGCKFSEIKEYVEDKSGKKVNMGDIASYVVDYIQVTGAGTFIVKFTNGESVAADLELNTKDENTATLKYEVSGEQEGIAIFNGVANGEIRFDKQGNCEMEVNANVDVNNDAYKGKVVFMVSKID